MTRDPQSPDSETSSAVRMLEVVRRHRLLAAAAFATIMAATASFALYLPDLYRATALVLVERTISESVVRTPVSGEIESRLYVIKQEILSRDRLTALIERFNLYPELRRQPGMSDALTQARNDISVEAAGPEQVNGRTKTVSFTLNYTSDRRDAVAEVTNAVAAFYVQQNDRMRSQEAVRTTQFLGTQLGEAKRALDQHDASMRDYTTRYTGELPQQVGVNLATLERLNTQLRLNGEQQIRIIEQRDTLSDGLRDGTVTARTAAGDADASPESLDRLRKIDEQRQKLAQAETQFTDRHPDVLRLREQLAVMEHEQEQADAADARKRAEATAATRAAVTADAVAPTTQIRRRTMESMDAELARLREEDKGVRQTITSFEQRLESTPQRQQEYQAITRDYNASKDLYDSLLTRFDEAQLTASMETDRAGERFRVLEPALPPEGPAAPNRIRLLLMGFMLACGAAAAAVFAGEQFDTAFHSVDDIRRFTSVPVLVSIPPIGPVPTGRRIRFAFGAVSSLAAIAVIAATVAYLASGNDHLVRLFAF